MDNNEGIIIYDENCIEIEFRENVRQISKYVTIFRFITVTDRMR